EQCNTGDTCSDDTGTDWSETIASPRRNNGSDHCAEVQGQGEHQCMAELITCSFHEARQPCAQSVPREQGDKCGEREPNGDPAVAIDKQILETCWLIVAFSDFVVCLDGLIGRNDLHGDRQADNQWDQRDEEHEAPAPL